VGCQYKQNGVEDDFLGVRVRVLRGEYEYQDIVNALVPEEENEGIGRVQLFYRPDAPFVFKKVKESKNGYGRPAVENYHISEVKPNAVQAFPAYRGAADEKDYGMNQAAPDIFSFPAGDKIGLQGKIRQKMREHEAPENIHLYPILASGSNFFAGAGFSFSASFSLTGSAVLPTVEASTMGSSPFLPSTA